MRNIKIKYLPSEDSVVVTNWDAWYLDNEFCVHGRANWAYCAFCRSENE